MQPEERILSLIQEIEKHNVNYYIKNNLQFSNVDLTTELVKEFPTLQGKVGGFYASLAGFKNDLCKAFSDDFLLFSLLQLLLDNSICLYCHE